MSIPANQNHTYGYDLHRGMIQPVANINLDTGDQAGLTSDPSVFPRAYDYQKVTSYSANNDPLIIQFYKGGSYDTGTGIYTGGTLQFTQYFTYDGSNRFISRYVQLN